VGREGGGLRPRGPSGEDCRELFVKGLGVDEGPLGVLAVAGVTVIGMDVLICCFGMDLDIMGDCQHLEAFDVPGDGVVADGAIDRPRGGCRC